MYFGLKPMPGVVLNRELSVPSRSVFRDLEVVRMGGRIVVRYKGNTYYGTDHSPVLSALLNAEKMERKVKQDIFGPTPPNVFVGEYGYPEVTVGPLVSLDAEQPAEFYGSQADWYGKDYSQIVSFATSLVRGKKKMAVKAQSRYLRDLQDATLSTKSVDLEVAFTEKPAFSYSFSPVAQPMGPSGFVDKVTLADNPKVPGKIDSIVSEGLLVREALPELFGAGMDYYYVQKVLSAGVLGRERRLVPTKWSITAADDMIGKMLLDDVRNYPSINEYRIHSTTFLDNHFEILLMPGKWEFEQFESWAPSTPWAEQAGSGIIQESEPFEGRTSYAEREGGGYYAGRLGVVEALHKMKRQARAVVFREIGEGYTVPVGVWEVRENSRNAMKQPPTKCSTLSEALTVLSTRLKHPIAAYTAKSAVLGQKKMTDY